MGLLDWGWIRQGIVIRITVRLRPSGLGLGGRLGGLGGPGGSASLRTETQCTTGIQALQVSVLCVHMGVVPGACVLHPEWKLTFLVCMGAHGRGWMVSVMLPKAVRMGLR